MPRIRKKTSKRGTTHQRTKIRQKVAESHKKRKRDAKKNPQWKSKHKKDPGIPSTLPFKEDILAEIELGRRQAEEERQRRKEAKSQADQVAPSPIVSTSVAATPAVEEDQDVPPILIDSSLPTLGSVIESADVILNVVDARDPQTFRSKRLEDAAVQKNKSFILVLTKTDLVPKENLSAWLTYLRSEISSPVVSFRASEALIPSTDKSKQRTVLHSISKDGLLDTITRAAKSRGEQEIRVAVVGLTNSGKSTLINSLLSTLSLPVYQPSLQQPKKATNASTTLGAQSVSLSHAERDICFIDTPGLGYAQAKARKGDDRAANVERMKANNAKDLLARNRGSFVHWEGTDAAAAYIVSRARHEDLVLHYNIPAYTPGDVTAFLGGVARASGRLQKYGNPDLADTARSIARDWSLGRLPFFAVPPPASVALTQSDPAVEACMSLKDMRAPPRPWPVQLDPGSPDERDVQLDAAFVIEQEERPIRVAQMEVDETEDSGSEEDEEESEDDEMESARSSEEDESEDESEEAAPAPVSALKHKRTPVSLNRTSKKVTFAVKQRPKPTPPRRVGNAKSTGKSSRVTDVTGEENYDFSKFF